MSFDEQNSRTFKRVEECHPNAFFNRLAKRQLEVRCIRQYYQLHRCFEKEKDTNTIAWFVIEEQLINDPTVVYVRNPHIFNFSLKFLLLQNFKRTIHEIRINFIARVSKHHAWLMVRQKYRWEEFQRKVI